MRPMAMGKRTSEQTPLWVPTIDLPVSPGHPFYTRLNRILDDAGFDRFAEEQCRRFYAPVMGRPSLPPRPVLPPAARRLLRRARLRAGYGMACGGFARGADLRGPRPRPGGECHEKWAKHQGSQTNEKGGG